MRAEEPVASPAEPVMAPVEAEHQQLLLASLWQRGASPDMLAGQLLPLPGPRRSATADDGLAVYRRNAWAGARRALALAYPVLEAMISTESLGALARELWLADPPAQGDLGEWGGRVAGWLRSQPTVADHPYLPELAALEWALHQAGRAADGGTGPVEGLALLADVDPSRIYAIWKPRTQLLCGHWPALELWQAHQPDPAQVAEDPACVAAVRAALEAGPQAQAVLVWRPQWRARCEALPLAWVDFSQALLAGQSLGEALEQHPVDFEAWLLACLRHGWLQAWASRPAGPGDEGDTHDLC